MADREVRVVVLGDSSSLQTSMVKGEAATANFETRLKNAVIVTGEAGALSDGLARKMNSLEQLGLTPASVGLIGLAASGGLVVEGTKTIIDNAEKNQVAQNNLTQAYKSQGLEMSFYQSFIDNFINTNKRFIADEYEAKNSVASLTRAGFDQATVMRIMNDALDISALKHISLTEATDILLRALQGNARGLIDLGIASKEVTAVLGAAPKSVKDVDTAQKDLEKSTAALAHEQRQLAELQVSIQGPAQKLVVAHHDTTAAVNALDAAQRRLLETQTALGQKHQSTALDAMHLEDAHKKVTDATNALAKAQANATTVKLSAAHQETTLQAMHLEDQEKKVADATKAVTDAQNDLKAAQTGVVTTAEQQKQVLGLLEPKIAKGRDTTSELTQAQRDLNHSTQEFSNKYGPALAEALANGLDIVNLTVQGISILATDTTNFLGGLGDWAKNTRGAAGQGHSVVPGGASNAQLPNVTTGTDRNAGTGGTHVTVNVTGPDPSGTSALVAAHLARMLS